MGPVLTAEVRVSDFFLRKMVAEKKRKEKNTGFELGVRTPWFFSFFSATVFPFFFLQNPDLAVGPVLTPLSKGSLAP
jgi:hypothetical protein